MRTHGVRGSVVSVVYERTRGNRTAVSVYVVTILGCCSGRTCRAGLGGALGGFVRRLYNGRVCFPFFLGCSGR